MSAKKSKYFYQQENRNNGPGRAGRTCFIKTLAHNVQDQQEEHDREMHRMHAQVQHIHECVAFAQSEKDLADRCLQELQQKQRGWSAVINSRAIAPVQNVLLTDVSAQLSVAQKTISDEVNL